ncbi:amino acid aminotransferase [Castellaniella caeni]
MSLFDQLQPQPGDPIFALADQCRRDSRQDKIDLTIGIYHSDDGRIPVLASVREAEDSLTAQHQPTPYLPIAGLPAYRSAAQALVFGPDSALVREHRVATVQTLGGSGALWLGARLLHSVRPDSGVWISDPAYPNHAGLFSDAGTATHSYPYYDVTQQQLTFDALMGCVRNLPTASIVLLHGCCHNPSGADLTPAQWRELLALIGQRGLIPFIDLAYQGFGQGLEEDAFAVRALAASGHPFLVAQSFSKNLSLYGERCGALSVVCSSAEEATRVEAQLVALIRRSYSNPPSHGARIIAHVLGNPTLRSQWISEVEHMRQHMLRMRQTARAHLAAAAPSYDASYLEKQHGMFSLARLTQQQIHALRDVHGVYVLDNGRLCIPGLNSRNVEHFARAMAAVTQLA